ncbi:TolC family outer membrane protein [Wenzhouxiangella limi]|uniref:TolC family outer membrane protein n=1 Tax=Wenzhouxiangella limi TaxID=2707351 RepID=A0A845UX67_9GAMM|nr:TolC family outer membrane protein [Wenzhouxiangella limi]NDY96017.1 TolC family outer membrane protein [Wenzhouxiangella limi]
MIKKTAVALSLSLALSPLAVAVDLLGVYELAQSNDAELRAAESRLAVAGEIPVQTRAALLPQLSGSASQTLGESSPSVGGNSLPTNDIDQRNYSIQLRQSIYDDANYGRLERGRAELAAADAQYREAFQNFLFRVSERYFDVLTALDTVRFAEAEETALRRQFEQAEQRFEVGLAAVTDVHEARATWDGARARVIVAQNTLEDAREALRETTGTWFENFARLIEDVPLSPPEPSNANEWVQSALETSPLVLQQRRQVDVADAELRIARAGHLPSLGLTGSYSRNQNNEFVARDPETQTPIGTTTFRTDGWQLGLTLDIPIFEGFATESRRRQAGQSLRLADEVLDQAERAVVRQTETAYRAVIAGIREVEARRQAVVSAESALEATNAGFEVGTRTIVDVLISEQRLFQAERNYSNARHQFILNGLRLRQAAGLLDEQDLVQVNQLLQ